jgi:hypothetical protein
LVCVLFPTTLEQYKVPGWEGENIMFKKELRYQERAFRDVIIPGYVIIHNRFIDLGINTWSREIALCVIDDAKVINEFVIKKAFEGAYKHFGDNIVKLLANKAVKKWRERCKQLAYVQDGYFWSGYARYKGIYVKQTHRDATRMMLKILAEIENQPDLLADAAKCFLDRNVCPSTLVDDYENIVNIKANEVIKALRYKWGFI